MVGMDGEIGNHITGKTENHEENSLREKAGV